jgi:outer membrane protein OmpA-like peptidoglycan-associated protein
VSSQLSDAGVKNSRLSIVGKGESQPVVSNDTDGNRSQNRRVEIAIYANNKMKAEAREEVGN